MTRRLRAHTSTRSSGALPATAPMTAATAIRTPRAHATTATSDYTVPPTIAFTSRACV
ncbi:hypothetical protein Rruber_05463 (plasmid) [Rhodococcus ruber]